MNLSIAGCELKLERGSALITGTNAGQPVVQHYSMVGPDAAGSQPPQGSLYNSCVYSRDALLPLRPKSNTESRSRKYRLSAEITEPTNGNLSYLKKVGLSKPTVSNISLNCMLINPRSIKN